MLKVFLQRHNQRRITSIVTLSEELVALLIAGCDAAKPLAAVDELLESRAEARPSLVEWSMSPLVATAWNGERQAVAA